MHTDSPALALVAEPQFDAARRVFLAASRAGPLAATPGAVGVGPGWFESSWDLRRGLVVSEADHDGLLAWSWRLPERQVPTASRGGASFSAT